MGKHTEGFLEAAVIVIENASSDTEGECARDCGPALYPAFARSPQMLQMFQYITKTFY